MDNIAQKLFALYIRTCNTNEEMATLEKLANLGISLDDVAENVGDGHWRTRYGNIEFQLDDKPFTKNMTATPATPAHPPYIHHGLGCENPDHSGWCTRNPQTCEMIVRANGTTLSREKYCEGRLCKHPVGTCMIMPPDRCWYA